MQVVFMKVAGHGNGVALVPETPEELRALLTQYEGEAYCEDCEAALDPEADECPTCGEGVACEPENRPTRRTQRAGADPTWGAFRLDAAYDYEG